MTTLIMPPLVDIALLTDVEAYDYGRTLYKDRFLNQSPHRGELLTHDGMPVIFWGDRYDHAFRTSSDRRTRPYDKDVVARTRIERINWIAKLLACDEPGIVCKEFSPPPQWKRAYFSLDHGHVVWLEPTGNPKLKPSAWRFSSSYNLPIPEVKRSTENGRILKK